MKPIAAVLTIVLCATASLHAELKIVSRTSVRPATTPTGSPSTLTFAMFGDMMLSLIAGKGPVDMTAIVSEMAARIEYAQSTFGMPAGVVMLVHANGDMEMLNPAERTFIRTTAKEVTEMWSQLGAQPTMTYKRTGEFSTVAGLRAERIAFEWTMDLGLSPEEKKALPADAPAVMTITGDIWVAADRYKQYAPMTVRTHAGLASLGMNKLLSEGVALRSVMRSREFNGQEIETIVTSIGEEKAPASTFQIPAGYKPVK